MDSTEQVAAAGIRNLTYRGKQLTDAYARAAAEYAVTALREAGRLFEDDHREPPAGRTHRPEAYLLFINPECGALDCEHEGECPTRTTAVCAECVRIAETAAPGWTESRFDLDLVAWPCAAARTSIPPLPLQRFTPVSEEMVRNFKTGWHQADLDGDAGNRVKRGIKHLLDATPAFDINVQLDRALDAKLTADPFTPTSPRDQLAELITTHRYRERGLPGTPGEREISIARPLADAILAAFPTLTAQEVPTWP